MKAASHVIDITVPVGAIVIIEDDCFFLHKPARSNP